MTRKAKPTMATRGVLPVIVLRHKEISDDIEATPIPNINNSFEDLLLDMLETKRKAQEESQSSSMVQIALCKRIETLKALFADLIAFISDDGIIRLTLPLLQVMSSICRSQFFYLDGRSPYKARIRVNIESAIEKLHSDDIIDLPIDSEEENEHGKQRTRTRTRGKREFLSVFLDIMKGEFDSALQWPFKNAVTLKAINPSGSQDISKSFEPVLQSDDIICSIGTSQFASIEELRGKGFINNDSVTVECIVHW